MATSSLIIDTSSQSETRDNYDFEKFDIALGMNKAHHKKSSKSTLAMMCAIEVFVLVVALVCLGLIVGNKYYTTEKAKETKIEHSGMNKLSILGSNFISNALDNINYHISVIGLTIGTTTTPALSCDNVFKQNPDATSGNYWILNTRAQPVYVYCGKKPIPNRSDASMIRVGFLNMSDPNEHCPPNFSELKNSPIRVCGRSQSINGCNSAIFSTKNIRYQRVCGRITAYRGGAGGTDGFTRTISLIENSYVDGVSLTHGRNPRNHIWSFAAGDYSPAESQYFCPCTNSMSTMKIPRFVRNDYFCVNAPSTSTEPLWDGEGCTIPGSTCCSFNNPPWFCKDLPQPTTDDIELRLCGDEAISDEDTPIKEFEIYIR